MSKRRGFKGKLNQWHTHIHPATVEKVYSFDEMRRDLLAMLVSSFTTKFSIFQQLIDIENIFLVFLKLNGTISWVGCIDP